MEQYYNAFCQVLVIEYLLKHNKDLCKKKMVGGKSGLDIWKDNSIQKYARGIYNY